MGFLDFLLFASLYNNSKLRHETANKMAEFSQDNYIWGDINENDFDDDDPELEEFREFIGLDGFDNNLDDV